MSEANKPATHSRPKSQKIVRSDDKRQCVMVIDDDNTIRATLQAALEKKYSVVGLSNGEDVVELIKSHRPHLLILDINLPGSDGFEICKEVRAKAQLGNFPILFMTSRKDDKSFLESLESGGNSFITKPFEISELREKIEYLLQSCPSA